LENNITVHESQGACRQDELIGSKPPVILNEVNQKSVEDREKPEWSQS
jgi:hypothetical protein